MTLLRFAFGSTRILRISNSTTTTAIIIYCILIIASRFSIKHTGKYPGEIFFSHSIDSGSGEEQLPRSGEQGNEHMRPLSFNCKSNAIVNNRSIYGRRLQWLVKDLHYTSRQALQSSAFAIIHSRQSRNKPNGQTATLNQRPS